MDANIVSLLRLRDKNEAVQDFKRKHKDWTVAETQIENLDRFPVAAVTVADPENKTLTLQYYPFASVMPFTEIKH
jgi:hypothetical protein